MAFGQTVTKMPIYSAELLERIFFNNFLDLVSLCKRVASRIEKIHQI